MGRSETDIADDEISRCQAAEREVEALRAEMAEQITARHEVQARLEQEVAQRDRIIAEGAQTEAKLRESETALLEAYLLDFDGDLYGEAARVEFVAHLREQARFDSIPALIDQMDRDVDTTRHLLGVPDPA